MKHQCYFSLAIVVGVAAAWISSPPPPTIHGSSPVYHSANPDRRNIRTARHATPQGRRCIAIIGAGWAGLAAAHTLSRSSKNVTVTVIEAAPRVGGLVRDGFVTKKGNAAEAGQHGFWNNYRNIFRLLTDEIDGVKINEVLTGYAEQGQYSPRGLEAVWPVYRDRRPMLPTGLAQAAYTRFLRLPLLDRLSAFPLVLAFSDFDDSWAAWERYDSMSFRDLCVKLGVSKRCFDEAFEPMILTGLFSPSAQCSAAAALGMAYFFVLQSQTAFDARWCRGNIGELIFDPWKRDLEQAGVEFRCNTRVSGFSFEDDDASTDRITSLSLNGNETLEVDDVILAVGANALNAFAKFCPELGRFREFQQFANLRGTSVLATRLFLNRLIAIPYTANACWGFDKGVGMTMFDIKSIHGLSTEGSVIEVDFYHASTLLVRSDDELVAKVKSDLDTILGQSCRDAKVIDAAIVRLPNAVNWYFPGSYQFMPDHRSASISNLLYCGDIVRSRHGSWSQEKAFVTGVQAANLALSRALNIGVIPAMNDEPHVKIGKDVVAAFRNIVGVPPFSIADFRR
jgi:uncharacterized protein with NAD-binding domain and iron-sulfur cluster